MDTSRRCKACEIRKLDDADVKALEKQNVTQDSVQRQEKCGDNPDQIIDISLCGCGVERFNKLKFGSRLKLKPMGRRCLHTRSQIANIR